MCQLEQMWAKWKIFIKTVHAFIPEASTTRKSKTQHFLFLYDKYKFTEKGGHKRGNTLWKIE